jgi:hypothetical protein
MKPETHGMKPSFVHRQEYTATPEGDVNPCVGCEQSASVEQRREKTRMLKRAMMQDLFTGRTRLV